QEESAPPFPKLAFTPISSGIPNKTYLISEFDRYFSNPSLSSGAGNTSPNFVSNFLILVNPRIFCLEKNLKYFIDADLFYPFSGNHYPAYKVRTKGIRKKGNRRNRLGYYNICFFTYSNTTCNIIYFHSECAINSCSIYGFFRQHFHFYRCQRNHQIHISRRAGTRVVI